MGYERKTREEFLIQVLDLETKEWITERVEYSVVAAQAAMTKKKKYSINRFFRVVKRRIKLEEV